MAENIGVLSAKITVDTAEVVDGVKLTRSELKQAARLMEQFKDPAVKMQEELGKLDRMFRANKLGINEYNKAVAAAKSATAAKSMTGGDDLGSALGMVAPRLSSITQAAGPLTAALGVGAVALGTFSAGWSALNKAMDVSVRELTNAYHELDRIGDTADMLGMTASALGQIESVARTADVSTQSLSAALERMAAGVGDALGADGETAFSKLNLDVMELATLAPEKQFAKIATQIDALPTRAEKLAAITDVFGKGNHELIKMIEGFDELNAAAAARRDFLTTADVAIVDDMDRSVREMSHSWERLWQETLVEIAPTLTKAADAMDALLENEATLARFVALFGTMADYAERMSKFANGFSKTFSIQPGSNTSWLLNMAMNPALAPLVNLGLPMLERDVGRRAAEFEEKRAKKVADDVAAEAAKGGGPESLAPLNRMLERMASEDQKKFSAWLKGGSDGGLFGSTSDIDRETAAMQKADQAREEYIARMEREAQTAGMNDRQRFAFDIAAKGFDVATQNYLLRLFDKSQAAKLEQRQLGTPAALKGSQEAAQAVARWMAGQKEQVDALDKIEENTRRMAEAGQFVMVQVEGAL